MVNISQKRLDIILDIIRENGFVTVKYLCDKLHYSTATINRDLNELKNQGIIKRNYGGAELISRKWVPLIYRTEKNKATKMQLAKMASYQLADYETIFINASTTTQYIGKYITHLKNIKVITNNINLVSYLSENNIIAYCLGGRIVEKPFFTGGSEAAIHAESFLADTMVFSTAAFSSDGRVCTGESYYAMYKAMIKNSKKVIFMVDSSKVNLKTTRVVCDFSDIDIVISDYKFSDEVKKNYPNTKFIEVADAKDEDENEY